MEFKKGNVVQLKSGGPNMTVTGVVGENQDQLVYFESSGYSVGDVTVEFFAGNKLERGTFRKETLVLID
ncbi:MAG TPA: DUF2158 domain-containing protein [Solidesulfovibrio magneticus]|nr:DUF2158 domain-containing protein [Solidesulfovibrio magneticus]